MLSAFFPTGFSPHIDFAWTLRQKTSLWLLGCGGVLLRTIQVQSKDIVDDYDGPMSKTIEWWGVMDE